MSNVQAETALTSAEHLLAHQGLGVVGTPNKEKGNKNAGSSLFEEVLLFSSFLTEND
jgi:hypothetical protein